MKKEINNQINGEINGMIKSDFSAIKKKMKKNEGVILEMKDNKKLSKKSIFAYAAMPALAAGLITVFVVNNNANTIVGNITLDVNPGIELSVNKKGDVKEVVAINEDAKKIVNEIDIIGDDLSDATDDIIEEMINQGYISSEKNSILVTTEGTDASKLKEEVTLDIKKYLEKNNIDASIVSQTIDNDDELEKLAEQYGISEGKAKLINKIIEVNNTYTFEALVILNTSDLNILLTNSKNVIDDIDYDDNVNLSNYKSSEEALMVVLNKYNIDKNLVNDLDIELDYDNNVMLFEIDFKVNNIEYEFDVNATTLEILKSEIDNDLTDNNDDDNDEDDNDNDDNDVDDDDNDDNDDDDDNDDNDDDDDNDDNDDDNDVDDNDDNDDDNDDDQD